TSGNDCCGGAARRGCRVDRCARAGAPRCAACADARPGCRQRNHSPNVERSAAETRADSPHGYAGAACDAVDYVASGAAAPSVALVVVGGVGGAGLPGTVVLARGGNAGAAARRTTSVAPAAA